MSTHPELLVTGIYRDILRSLPQAVLVVNAGGLILFSNSRAEGLLGYSSERLRQLSIVSCFPDWFHLVAGGSVFGSTAVSSDGTNFPVEVGLSVMPTEHGPLLLASVRDARDQTARFQDLALEQENLRVQVHELGSRQHELQLEMNEAAQIIEAHLPARALSIPGCEFSWTFSPCHTLGGDMLKVVSFQEKSVALCILDVSGHGIPASLLAISLARVFSGDRSRGGLLKDRAGALRTPSDVVSRLNERSQVLHEGDQFVTLLYGILDLVRGGFRYVSAGHPHPILKSAGKSKSITGLTNPPLGVIPRVEFVETVVQVAAGDTLVLYTDGVTETRNVAGEMFGEDRILALLDENAWHSPQEFLTLLHSRLDSFRGGQKQKDDATSMILRREPKT